MNPAPVLRRLYGLHRILRLHRADNDAVARALDALQRDLEAFHAEYGTCLIQVLTGELFVNRQLVRPDDTTRPLFEELASIYTGMGIEAVALLPGVSRHSLDSLAHQIASGGVEPSKVGHIRVAAVDPRRNLRRLLSPEEQARQIYAELYRAVAELQHDPGRTPRRRRGRAVLLAAEGVAEHPGAFRGLRLQGRADPRVHLACQRTVKALHLAAAMGRSPSDRLVVGLASVLSAMVPGDEDASWLLRFSGLGALTPRVVLAVHESRTATRPEEASPTAQILALSQGRDDVVDPALSEAWAPKQRMAQAAG